jgi:uncharacterized protein (DUF885 family)
MGSTAASAGSQSLAESALARVIVEHEKLIREADPVTAGQEGDLEALRRLPDVGLEALQTRRKRMMGIADQLMHIPVADLSEASAFNYRYLSWLVKQSLEESGYDLDRISFTNDDGFHTLADYLARTTVIDSAATAEAWLSRLDALPIFYQQNFVNLRRGIRTQFTQPRIVVDRVLEVARLQASVKPEDSPLLLPLARLPSTISMELQEGYRSRALKAVRDRILSERQAFVELLEKEYLPAVRSQLSWRSLPAGDTTYRFFVRRETTTDLSPEQIHALGLSEVARIRDLMEGILKEVRFSGSLAQFLQQLRNYPRFYAHSPQELLEKASEIAKRADGQLPRFFGKLPRLTYGVQAVPAEIADGYTTGRYWLGSPVQGQAGAFMVNTSHLDQRPLYELPALTLHEAVPGHHLQTALSQEMTNVPYFRRQADLTAFDEGWGLYSEYLGEEMGIYRDAYERFGRYSYEMWRACRLVVDTGIHWLGWDMEKARLCFTENTALAPHNIQTELERYISWPGQALAYKVGELKFRALRKEAEQRLGSRFDLRGFHDQLLQGGSLPLDLVERQTHIWIERQLLSPQGSASQ